jgi:putative endonuclease
MWYLYLLRCRNGSLYTGITTNIPARLKAHQSGKGAKYTRAFGPVSLVYTKKMRTGTLARKKEAEIKGWSKEKKERLVKTTSSYPSSAF